MILFQYTVHSKEKSDGKGKKSSQFITTLNFIGTQVAVQSAKWKLKSCCSKPKDRKTAGEKNLNDFHPLQFRLMKFYSISKWEIFWSINTEFMIETYYYWRWRNTIPDHGIEPYFTGLLQRVTKQTLIPQQKKLGQILKRVYNSCTL